MNFEEMALPVLFLNPGHFLSQLAPSAGGEPASYQLLHLVGAQGKVRIAVPEDLPPEFGLQFRFPFIAQEGPLLFLDPLPVLVDIKEDGFELGLASLARRTGGCPFCALLLPPPLVLVHFFDDLPETELISIRLGAKKSQGRAVGVDGGVLS